MHRLSISSTEELWTKEELKSPKIPSLERFILPEAMKIWKSIGTGRLKIQENPRKNGFDIMMTANEETANELARRLFTLLGRKYKFVFNEVYPIDGTKIWVADFKWVNK